MSGDQVKKKPNIIIITTDHHSNTALASNGFERHSPASDRLAREGVAFTHAFKYVYNAGDIDELYDLRNDAAELNNVADDPSYAAELKRLRALLYDTMKRTDDWALPFAYSRLVENDSPHPCEKSPAAHRISGAHDIGLRTNCPWCFRGL